MSLFCAFLSLSLFLSLLKQNQNNNNNKKPYVSVYFFSLFSSFWNFKHKKRCQSNSPESNFPGWTWRWKITSLTKPGLWGQFNQHYEESSEKLCQPCLQKCFCVAGTTGCYKLDRSQHKAEATKMALILQCLQRFRSSQWDKVKPKVVWTRVDPIQCREKHWTERVLAPILWGLSTRGSRASGHGLVGLSLGFVWCQEESRMNTGKKRG